MNNWTKKSINLAKNTNYLDQLFDVYPIELDFTPRSITESDLNKVWTYYKNKDYGKLIKILFSFSKFPIDYAYVGFLKKYNDGIDLNPKTVERIGKYLTDKMKYEDIVKMLKSPKKSSRKMGPMFQTWIKQGGLGTKYEIFDKDHISDFLNSEFGILCCGDKKLKNICAEYFGYTRVEKGLDFLCKVKNKIVIGEAKFVSASGGTQDKSFKDIKSLLCSEWNDVGDYEVIPIGILDGFPLIQGGHFIDDLNHDNWNIMSVLVLKEFLSSLE